MSSDAAPLAVRETSSLIASDQVSGTKIFAADGSKLGSVHNFMVAKRTGQVAYVVISTGGFLGLGQAYHPLPWHALRYDEQAGGYVIDIDRTMLAGGPSYRPDSTPMFDDAYGQRIDDYYRAVQPEQRGSATPPSGE